MALDDQIDETELASIHSNKSLISGDENGESSVVFPYKVIYQGREVTIDSKNIKESGTLKVQYVVLSLCFLLFGLADSTVGTVMPSLIKEYDIDHSQASYLFSAQFAGYLISSLMSNYLISNYGFYGALIICEAATAACFFVVAWKPPFAIIVASYVMNGFGAGILDSSGNLWIGKLEYCNELLGMIHAEYGVGGMLSPVLITKLVNKGYSWSLYYAFMAAISFSILVSVAVSFRWETSYKFRYIQSQGQDEEFEDVKIMEVVTNKLVWFFSFVLFIYVGGEMAAGSWIYNYLIIVKDQSSSTSSYITSAYWLFLTLGRVVLGFVIGHWFNKKELTAVTIFCSFIATASIIYTVFYKVLVIQVMAMMALGFFIGPMFPTIVVVAMKYLPHRLETAGVGMLVAMGGGGAAVIPFLIGLVSELKPNGGGLIWFPLITVIIFGTDAVLFIVFYMKNRHKE